MNKMIFAAAALAASLATPAFAQDVTSTLTINATVGVKCSLTNNGSATLTIPELADSTGKINTAAINSLTASFAGYCNGANSTMHLEMAPLINTATAPTGFTNLVTYQARAELAGNPGANTQGGSDRRYDGGKGRSQNANVFVFNDTINITFFNAGYANISSNNTSSHTFDGPLLGGSYTGSVVLVLTPAA